MKRTKAKKSVTIVIFTSLILLITFYIKYIAKDQSYAYTQINYDNTKLKISSAKQIDLNEIIKNNIGKNSNKEEIYEKYEELEYITKYRNSSDLYVGTTKVAQEGKNGIQTITMKKIFDNEGNFIKEEQVDCKVTKSSLDKIIEIGTKIYVEPKNENKNISGDLSLNMALNRPSGFTLEQFQTALTDSKDINNIFKDNAQYFYYIEEQYNINGMFVAAIGIHESAWGTSKIAKNKFNLFGYGAYDSNPYNGAYTFSSYSESIDLLARVLVKHYLNPKNTKIYDGQVATGKYYNGNDVNSVNKKYATDKNWANCVYKYMEYLYGKIV